MTNQAEGRLTMDRRYVWTDLWTFEALYTRSKSEGHTARLESCRKAFGLYQGEFLADESCLPQIIAKREQVRDQFIHIGEPLEYDLGNI